MVQFVDVLLTGGTVIDGTGAPAQSADVGVTGDRIVFVGATPAGVRADRTLDCSGAVVTPGFIDLHSHHDFTLDQSPDALACIFQGVTTVVTGNCGMSPFPVPTGQIQSMGSITGDGSARSWVDFDSFASDVQGAGPAVNVAALVGHGTLRTAVLGEEKRSPTGTEREAMCSLLKDAARQGVFGFSTGLIYAPGSFADSEEIISLAEAAASLSLLYSTHIRDEGDGLLDAVAEAIAVASASGVRLQISHLKAIGPANHGKVRIALWNMEHARKAGVDVATDVYPYAASSTRLSSRLPDWALNGGYEALLKRLADPADRELIRSELNERVGRTFLPDGIVFASMPQGPYCRWTGFSLAHIAETTGADAADVALDALARHQGQVWIVNHAMDEADVAAVLRDPFTAVASDGWVMGAEEPGHPHPRHFGTFARVVENYVQEQRLFPLAEAIRKMTAFPAQRVGLTGRGVLREQFFADLAVFDAAQFSAPSSYEDPRQYARGIRHVLVNGVPTVQGGQPTGQGPGRVLRKA